VQNLVVISAVVGIGVVNGFEKIPPVVKTKLKGSVANVDLTGELPWGGKAILTFINSQ